MGVSFLTPFDALFALTALLPLTAFLLAQRRAEAVRRLFSLPIRRGRELAVTAAALVLLPALLGVAATQPVIVRQEPLQQRADSEALFVFDISTSMQARSTATSPTRLTRAKRDAIQLEQRLGNIPAGIAVMTDRTLPLLMPTTDLGLFVRTVRQSVEINSPPPSRHYSTRASSFTALTSMRSAQFFPPGVTHPILVVFTDGETTPLPPTFALTFRPEDRVPVLGVHVWQSDERVFVNGRAVQGYAADPSSSGALRSFAELTGGHEYTENELGDVAKAIRSIASGTPRTTTVEHYSRVALAPWFVLAGVLPLGFLLWRRNL